MGVKVQEMGGATERDQERGVDFHLLLHLEDEVLYTFFFEDEGHRLYFAVGGHTGDSGGPK